MANGHSLRFLIATFTSLLLATQTASAQIGEQRLVRDCEAQVAVKFKQWRYAPVSKEVAEASRRQNENPVVLYGDFDGDHRKDVALLIQEGPSPDPDYPRRLDSAHIAVCLSLSNGAKLYLIDKLYCADGIARSPQGQPYYDFETGQRGAYKFDGIHAYCFEKAGATYEYDSGRFRAIVDSD